jgi:hypothetical protein
VAFSPDGATIVSGSNDKTIKVWDAGVSALTPSNPYHPLKARAPLWPHTDTLQLVEERKGDGSALDASGSGAVAERDGATLHLKEGGGSRASRRTGPGSSRAHSRASCTT